MVARLDEIETVPVAGIHWEAAARGTAVLVVGALPGKAFRPSPWESSFTADAHLRAGDHERAFAFMHATLAEYPDHPATPYNLACFEAVAGRADDAVAHLRRAHELDPTTRQWAADVPDLDPIRDHPDFPYDRAAPDGAPQIELESTYERTSAAKRTSARSALHTAVAVAAAHSAGPIR